jgi:hypothetical protein
MKGYLKLGYYIGQCLKREILQEKIMELRIQSYEYVLHTNENRIPLRIPNLKKVKVKGKVVPDLFSTQHHVMKTY